jgi:TonB family protein
VQINSYKSLATLLERSDTADANLEKPSFTPYTVPPGLINREDVGRAMATEYPRNLRSQGIGGTVLLWLLIDETGKMERVRVKETSGYGELDAAAIRVGYVMKFSPALNRSAPTKVWIALPLMFKTGQR